VKLHPWNTGEQPDLYGVARLIQLQDARNAQVRRYLATSPRIVIGIKPPADEIQRGQRS